MFFLTPFLTFLTFTFDYCKGFTQAEILQKRIDVISTIVMTLFIMNGCKPFFNFFKNIIFFIKDLFLGIFWPHKKLNHLHHNQEKLAFKKEKLKFQIELLEEKKAKLDKKIEKTMYKINKKKERKGTNNDES